MRNLHCSDLQGNGLRLLESGNRTTLGSLLDFVYYSYIRTLYWASFSCCIRSTC